MTKMRRAAPILACAMLLAGCGDTDMSDEVGENGEPRIRIANPHHDELTELRPALQRLAMLRAIRGSGFRCQRVDNTGYQEEYRNMRMWVAECGEEQKRWAVFIAPTGDVQVRDCAEAGQLALPRCEPLPPAVPDEIAPVEEGAADEAFRNEI